MSYVPRLVDPLLDELFGSLPALLIVGPRACGKTTTAARRAASTVQFDVPAQTSAFLSDPDAILRGLPEPVLLDEWQLAPEALGAVKRAVDVDGRPGRFLLTGSASGDLEPASAAGAGRVVRVHLSPMTVVEQSRRATNHRSLFDRLAAGASIAPAGETPDVRGYVDLALRSGFPEALQIDSNPVRRRWLEGYVAQTTTRDESAGPGRRDPARLRRFLEAYALNSAGTADASTINAAAGVDHRTGSAYEALLQTLFMVDSVPAWTSNRLRRLTLAPKRYIVDAAVMAAIIGVDAAGVLGNGDLLGRLLDTFVVSQLRAELEVSESRPRLFHLRDRQGRREVDVVAELSGGGIVACEIKAGAAVSVQDARHLMWLRDELADAFVAGVVFHTGPHAFGLQDRITALPIATIWSREV